MRRTILTLSLLAATAACSSAPVASGEAPAGHRNLIERGEIELSRTPGSSAWDLIAQLRPQFLRSRGPASLRDASPSTAVVYLDNVLFGDIASLRTISADSIVRIEYVNAADATTRFGSDRSGGAILLLSR